ncbi:MAG: heavy-metal-associated domain-containing protein [Candidatus Levybacteria bacterium]|nr:heavy-metal-associated domain-containing protein [Candidatus Levybacteria bacterium]
MIRKIVFKIEGMHCSSCAMTIDWALEETGGVKSAKTNYAKSQTEVAFDEEKATENDIIAVIKHEGYDAKPLGVLAKSPPR